MTTDFIHVPNGHKGYLKWVASEDLEETYSIYQDRDGYPTWTAYLSVYGSTKSIGEWESVELARKACRKHFMEEHNLGVPIITTRLV